VSASPESSQRQRQRVAGISLGCECFSRDRTRLHRLNGLVPVPHPAYNLARLTIYTRDGSIARQTSPPTSTQTAQAPPAALPASPGTSTLTITQEPATSLEVKNLLGKWRARPTTPQAIKMAGTVTLACASGGARAGMRSGSTRS
jgi:hypothetical protein